MLRAKSIHYGGLQRNKPGFGPIGDHNSVVRNTLRVPGSDYLWVQFAGVVEHKMESYIIVLRNWAVGRGLHLVFKQKSVQTFSALES